MAKSNNFVSLIGRLTKDAYPIGEKGAKFSLAVDRGVKNKETGQWENKGFFVNDLVVWNFDRINELTKGVKVHVICVLEPTEYTDKNGNIVKKNQFRVVRIDNQTEAEEVTIGAVAKTVDQVADEVFATPPSDSADIPF